MIAASKNETLWRSSARRALLFQLEKKLCSTRIDRDRWRDIAGELISARNGDADRAIALAIKACRHFSAHREAFDILLDWFNDIQNPALSDSMVCSCIPVDGAAFLGLFWDDEKRLTEAFEDWRREHMRASLRGSA